MRNELGFKVDDINDSMESLMSLCSNSQTSLSLSAQSTQIEKYGEATGTTQQLLTR